MEQLPRQQYTKEFREQAVQRVLEQKLTIPEAARRLTLSGKPLERWVCRARPGQLATLGESRRPVTDLEAELSRLQRELAEARMERDSLKKATAYFAKAQRPGTRSCGRCGPRIRCVCCAGSLTCPEAGTMPGAPAAPRHAPRRTRGWKGRSRPPLCGPASRMARNGCKPNGVRTAFQLGSVASSGCGRNWACAVHRCAGSRPPWIRRTRCRWQRTCWLRPLPPDDRTRPGSPIVPLCRPWTGGGSGLALRLSTPVRWSAMRGTPG